MWIKPTLNEDNTSGAIRVDVKISAVKVGEKSAKFILADKSGNKLLCKDIALEDTAGMVQGSMMAEV